MLTFNIDRNEFQSALWRAAGKGWRRGSITLTDRRLIRRFLRNPTTTRPFGESVDLAERLQGRVETLMIRAAQAKRQSLRFDWITLLAFLLEILPLIIEIIQELFDHDNDDADE